MKLKKIIYIKSKTLIFQHGKPRTPDIVSNISFQESEFCCSEAYKHNLIYKQQLMNFFVCTVFPVSEQLITLSLQV